MNRRDLIKNTLISLTSMISAPSFSATSKEISSEKINHYELVVPYNNIPVGYEGKKLYLYVGKANTDPAQNGNQIIVKGIDLSIKKQPIIMETSKPIENLLTTRHYSISIYDDENKLIFYSPDMEKYMNKKNNNPLQNNIQTSSIISGDTTLDRITSVNVLTFGAHCITEPGYENFDSTDSFQKAIEYVNKRGGGNVLFSGHYLLNKYKNDFIFPHDDGSIFPTWVSEGDERNIAPEKNETGTRCLRLYNNISLIGDGAQTSSLYFGWDVSNGDISPSSGIGIHIRSKSRYAGDIKYRLKGFTIKNAFISHVVDGIATASSEDDFKILNCGIAGIYQGLERCEFGTIEISGCYAGQVIGGWWLQRNHTTRTEALPPYPAKDVNSLGWTDFSPTHNLIVSQLSGIFGKRHKDIDAFFDIYFFKSKNNKKNGRLSKSSIAGGFIDTYQGIAGRARTVISRYGRQINILDIEFMKIYGCHRTPVVYSKGAGRNVIKNCYIEGVGLVDNKGSNINGNLFGIDNKDELSLQNEGIGFLICSGQIAVEQYTISSRCQFAPLQEHTLIDAGKKRSIIYTKSVSDSIELTQDRVWDGKNTEIKYSKYTDYCYSQPIQFNLGGEKFDYRSEKFEPKLKIGSSIINGIESTGTLKKIGNTIVLGISISTKESIKLPEGNMKIIGLPNVSSNMKIESYHGMVSEFSTIKQGIPIGIKITENADEVILTTDTKGTLLSTESINEGVHTIRISLTAILQHK